MTNRILGKLQQVSRSIAGSTPEHELQASIHAAPTGPAPGVGLCLSGGGSRAFAAGMGQLRALAHLQVNNEPLLGKISALSTASGGSWIGVPWTYLQGTTSDNDYLGTYIDAPGRLTLTSTPGGNDSAAIDHLPPGNPGHNIGHHFRLEDLLLQMVALRLRHGTPWNMMWQILIARHLLHPYGLYTAGKAAEPTSLFTLDHDTLKRDVVGPNSELAHTTAHLIASATDPSRMTRPFLICNTAMFVNSGQDFNYLAPVQATPLYTGIWGNPDGVDANGRTPGGGGVTSFAFSSDPLSTVGDSVVVGQTRPLSLTDIVGASSAAFAEELENLLSTATPEHIHNEIVQRRDHIADHMRPHLERRDLDEFLAYLEHIGIDEIKELIRDLAPQALIPKYKYWPVSDPAPEQDVKPTRFADAGNLENTGIAGMLIYEQIHSIISCVNADQALTIGNDKILQVTANLPVLFGLQPYQKGHGYLPYAEADVADLGNTAAFRHNHVFETNGGEKTTGFDELLAGLQAATGEGHNTTAAIFRQTLTTVENCWFGIDGGRDVEVIWCLLNPATTWNDQLTPEVRHIVDELHNFPNYSTLKTQLTPQEVNLLSSQAAWCIANDKNKDTFIGLFSN